MNIFRSLLFCIKCYALIITFSSFLYGQQQLAFPTAYGAGSFTTGGRGLDVFHVTNLNDNGTGSLRQAVSNAASAGGGTIVFDISGIIVLTSILGFTDNLTIAGQTAPDGGITIDGERVFVGNVDNLIVRYIRFRGGIDGNDDSLTVRNNVTNQIWDHCSFGFGDDEGASWYETQSQYSVDNLTVQRCLFAENSKGSIVGGKTGGANTGEISFNYNLFYNNSHRFPNTSGVDANIEVINNVVWNVKSRLVRTNGSGQNLNHIGNYYHYNNRGINDTRLHHFSYENGYPNIYTNGNKIIAPSSTSPLVYNVSEMNADNTLAWKHFMNDGVSTPYGTRYKGDQLEPDYFTNIQHPLLGNPVTILEADQAFDNVRSDVGCNKRLKSDGSVSNNLDLEDEDYLNQINLGNYNTPLGNGSYNVIFFEGNTRPSDFYQSNPHIPEVWFNSNVPAGQNHNDIAPSGYTWLEEYLNMVDVDIAGNVEATGLNITPDVATLNITENIDLNVQFIPVNTSDQSGVWVSENEAIATVDDNGTVTAISEGVVEIRFVSNDGGFTDISFITVIPTPVSADAGEDQTICVGDSVALSASGGTNFLWNNGETTPTIEVNPLETTTYSVTVSDGNQEDTDEVTVFVDVLPILNVSSDITIVEGDNVVISAEGASNYLWSTGETTSSITVSPNTTETYTVIGTNGVCDVQAQVTVAVEQVFQANAGDDQSICEGSGDEVTLSAGDGDTYLWSTGETTQSIIVNPVSTTTYSVTISSGIQEDSDDVTVFVDAMPNLNISDDVTIITGEIAVLTAEGANTYLWSTGETTSSITVSPNTTETYTVIGTNGVCDVQAQVTVAVEQVFQANAGDDQSICEGSGDEVTLSAGDGDTYLWSTGETTQSIIVNPVSTTTYSVTISSGIQEDSDDVTVFVDAMPNLNISDDVTIITGEIAVLTAEGANTYLWSTGETTSSITVSPNTTETYTVIGTNGVCDVQAQVTVAVEQVFQANAGDDQSICEGSGDEVTLSAGDGDTYLWSTGETTQSIIVNPVSTTTYSVTILSGIQEDSDDVTVFVDPNPNVVIVNGDSVDILNGDFITLSASGANNYEWNNGATQPNIAVSPNATTTYEVRGYINDCYDEKQVTVNVFEPVQASAGEDINICLNEVATLTATGGDEFLWSTGETTQSIQVSPFITTDYTVTVFNALDFDEAAVRVNVLGQCNDNTEDENEVSRDDVSFNIYPNPAHSYINVSLKGGLEISNVLIYDFTGKIVQQNRIENQNQLQEIDSRIELRSLSNGIYFIKIIDVHGIEITKKLIKRDF